VRRKVVVRLIDERWHERCLTVDYQLNPFVAQLAQADGVAVVPLPVSLITRDSAIDYDIFDCRGNRCCLPTLDERLFLSAQVLRALAQMCLYKPYTAGGALTPVFTVVSSRSPTNVERVLAGDALGKLATDMRAWRTPTARSCFISVAFSLMDRTILTIDAPVQSDQATAKLRFLGAQSPAQATSPEAAGLAPFLFTVNLAGWKPGSMHLGIEAPEGIEILRASARGVNTSFTPSGSGTKTPPYDAVIYSVDTAAVPDGLTEASRLQINTITGSRSHLNIAHPSLVDRTVLDVEFRLARSGFLSAAAWISAVIAFVFLIIVVALPSFRSHSDAGDAFLLAFPALGAAIVTQYSGHAVTTLMLTTVRRALYLSSLLAFLGCALLLIDSKPATEPLVTTAPATLSAKSHLKGHHSGLWHSVLHWGTNRWPWLLLLVATSWIAGLCFVARRVPSASPRLPTSHRALQIITRPLVKLLGWPHMSRRT
jgi:hypothetical protein